MEITLSQELSLSKVGNVVRIGVITLLFIIAYWHSFVDLNAKYAYSSPLRTPIPVVLEHLPRS